MKGTNSTCLNNTTIMYILLMLIVIANIFLVPKMLMAQIFALVYLTIIYKFFNEGLKKFIYYSTLMFSIVDFGLVLPLGSRFGIYYFYVTMFIYMLMWLIDTIKNWDTNKWKSIVKNKYFIFAVVFVIYMVMSFFIAVDKKKAIVTMFVYVMMITYTIMLVIENKKSKDLKGTLKLLEYVFIGILALGILKISGLNIGIRNVYSDMGYTEAVIPFLKRMPIIFFYNPNNYGVFLVLAMTGILCKLCYTEELKTKMYYGAIYVLAQINLIFTSSRTSWVTLILTCIFLLFISLILKKKKLAKNVLIYLVITFGVFGLFSILPNMDLYYGKFNATPILNKLNVLNRKKLPQVTIQSEVSVGGSGSLSERYTLMHNVMKGVFEEKHILGFGPGNTMNYIKTQANTQGIYNIHSLWFEILGDFGVFIFICYAGMYLILLFELFVSYARSKNTDNKINNLMVTAGLFAFVFLAFAPSSVLSYVPYWLLLGLSFSLVININKNEG